MPTTPAPRELRHRMSRLLLVLLAIVLSACAREVVTPIPRPFDYIPARWVDLPEAPFVAKMRGDKALLIARSWRSFSHVAVGCVVPAEGKTKVLTDLVATLTTHGSFGPQWPVDGLLASLNNPEVYTRLTKQCPGHGYFAVTRASGGERARRITWSAEGTKWPRQQ